MLTKIKKDFINFLNNGLSMIRIKEILAGKKIGKHLVKKQQLSSAMAWQILNQYPTRTSKSWNIYKNLHGILLADEVGSGKTFESLAIITKSFIEHLQVNKRNFRVLIIAHPAIRSKWEWSENECDLAKFYSQVRIKNKSYNEKLKKLLSTIQIIKTKNKWKELNKNLPSQCIILSSIHTLPPTSGKKTEANFKRHFGFPANKFNWIIADEAHIFKSGYSQTDEDVISVSSSAVRKLYSVLNSQEKAKIILLTATPFHNNVKEFKQMISLLDHRRDDGVVNIVSRGLEYIHEEFNSLKEDFAVENDFSDRLTKIYQAANDNVNLLFGQDEHPFNRPKQLKGNGQRNGLDDFLRDLMIRNKKKKLDETIRLVELSEVGKLNYLLNRDLILTEEDDAKKMISTQLCQLVSNPESFRKSLESKNSSGKGKRLNAYKSISKFLGDDILYDSKLNEVIDILNTIKPGNKNIITVFCRFIPAIDCLQKDLKNKGYKIYRLDGQIKVDERKKIISEIEIYNKKSKALGILLVSQVGNEGLDFDQFSNTILHFDGHYNPAVIAQRNGRVYRRANKQKDISVYHLILRDTYDQRIKFIEEEKKRLKDFYLGDGNLEQLFQKILNLEQDEKKSKLKKLLRFTIDLEAKEKYLLPNMKREVG